MQGQDKSDNLTVLNNGAIKRVISGYQDNKGITTSSMTLIGSEKEFLDTGSEEFYFEIDGIPITGQNNWDIISTRDVEDSLLDNE